MWHFGNEEDSLGVSRCVSTLTVLATTCDENANTSGHDGLPLSLLRGRKVCARQVDGRLEKQRANPLPNLLVYPIFHNSYLDSLHTR